MSAVTLPLDAPQVDLARAGGKAASLSLLARAGFPVPLGFVLTTDAYIAFVASAGLERELDTVRSLAAHGEWESVATAAKRLRERFESSPVQVDLASEVCAAYRALSDVGDRTDLAVAVRSSATAEDLPEASFAGQQESFLNVRGEADLLRAVRRCWASLWTDRAIAYRQRQGSGEGVVSLAVVVQVLVQAESAGVLFTANPVSGDDEEVVIDAAWGLGETVVGGTVNPDTVLVDKATGRVRHVETGDKAVMSAPTESGTTLVDVPAERRLWPVLTAEHVARLVRLGRDVEAYFRAPQDIEWAISGDHVFLLQARPITTLAGRSDRATTTRVTEDDDWPALGTRPPQPYDLWTRVNVGEAYVAPLSPISWSALPATLGESFANLLRGLDPAVIDRFQWVNRFYGRLYFNEGAMVYLLSHHFGLPGTSVDSAWGSRRGGVVGNVSRFHLLRFLQGFPVFARMCLRQTGAEGRLVKLFPRADAWFAEYLKTDLSSLDDRTLYEDTTFTWQVRSMAFMNLYTLVSNSSVLTFSALDNFVRKWCAANDLATHDLVTGLSGVYAAQMGVQIWEIAQRIVRAGLRDAFLSASPAEALSIVREDRRAQSVREALDLFLESNGHRCPGELDWVNPRWIEAPENVLAAVAGYLRAGDSAANPATTEATQSRRRQEAEQSVEGHLDPVRRAVFRLLLKRAQHAVLVRDNGRHELMKLLFPLRRTCAELGRRWSQRGWIAQPEDVFFLTLPELEALAVSGDLASVARDLPSLVAARRAAYLRWFKVSAPEVIGPDRQPIQNEVAEHESESLRGIPVSAGRARGVARIVLDPAEALRLPPGSILVTRATDPGWTPAFPLLGGLVLEVGGQLSHGAIVAREYGVPAVVNVRDATTRIKEGQVLEVDGAVGVVTVVPDP